MLSLPPTVRIWLAARPADLRKSFDGLAALVRDGLRGDPLSGDIFVFRNKSADRIKLLLWEEDGYAIWYKRLEKGSYRFPPRPTDRPSRSRSAPRTWSCSWKGSISSSVKRGKRYHRPVARPPLEPSEILSDFLRKHRIM